MGPWRGESMRHVQEVAAAEFIAAWDRQREIKDRRERLSRLSDEIAELSRSRDGHLLLVGELRFGVKEIRSCVQAVMEDAEGRGPSGQLAGRTIYLYDADGFYTWAPDFPRYGGGVIADRDGQGVQRPRNPEPTL